MSFWNAASDRDWEAELNPRPKTVERECVVCHQEFPMALSEGYVLNPACDSCVSLQQERNEQAKAEAAARKAADDEYFRSGTRYPGQ